MPGSISWASPAIQASPSKTIPFENAPAPLFSQINLGNKIVQDLGDVYLLKNTNETHFYQVYEKLPAGGFGRLLRYRGLNESGRWIDLEYVYEDSLNRLTVLDYASGRFYRITFQKNQTESSCLFPLKDEKGFNKDLYEAPHATSKLIYSNIALTKWALPEISQIFSTSAGLTGEDIWSQHLLRGPPAEVSAQ